MPDIGYEELLENHNMINQSHAVRVVASDESGPQENKTTVLLRSVLFPFLLLRRNTKYEIALNK